LYRDEHQPVTVLGPAVTEVSQRIELIETWRAPGGKEDDVEQGRSRLDGNFARPYGIVEPDGQLARAGRSAPREEQ
jgi:hypothetical protein